MAVKDDIAEINNLIECVHDRLDVYENKVAQMLHRLQVIDNFEYFLNLLEKRLNDFYANMEKLDLKYQDLDEKLSANISKVNEMTLELKGVIAQARSCVNERKDFVKNLGAALQELT